MAAVILIVDKHKTKKVLFLQFSEDKQVIIASSRKEHVSVDLVLLNFLPQGRVC